MEVFGACSLSNFWMYSQLTHLQRRPADQQEQFLGLGLDLVDLQRLGW